MSVIGRSLFHASGIAAVSSPDFLFPAAVDFLLSQAAFSLNALFRCSSNQPTKQTKLPRLPYSFQLSKLYVHGSSIKWGVLMPEWWTFGLSQSMVSSVALFLFCLLTYQLLRKCVDCWTVSFTSFSIPVLFFGVVSGFYVDECIISEAPIWAHCDSHAE